jgi:hypothetical protein
MKITNREVRVGLTLKRPKEFWEPGQGGRSWKPDGVSGGTDGDFAYHRASAMKDLLENVKALRGEKQ